MWSARSIVLRKRIYLKCKILALIIRINSTQPWKRHQSEKLTHRYVHHVIVTLVTLEFYFEIYSLMNLSRGKKNCDSRCENVLGVKVPRCYYLLHSVSVVERNSSTNVITSHFRTTSAPSGQRCHDRTIENNSTCLTF